MTILQNRKTSLEELHASIEISIYILKIHMYNKVKLSESKGQKGNQNQSEN